MPDINVPTPETNSKPLPLMWLHWLAIVFFVGAPLFANQTGPAPTVLGFIFGLGAMFAAQVCAGLWDWLWERAK